MRRFSLDPLGCGIVDLEKIGVQAFQSSDVVPQGLNGEGAKLSYLPLRGRGGKRGRLPNTGTHRYKNHSLG